MAKTYMRRVFGSADKSWIGIDQGKGKLYRGDSVRFALNAVFHENVFRLRKGAVIDSESGAAGAVHGGSDKHRAVGVEVYYGE